jgi:3-oxoacyl-ACP reductase-like protein
MSKFSELMHKIFSGKQQQPAAQAPRPAPAQPAAARPAAAPAQAAPKPAQAQPTPAAAPAQAVDVEQVLEGMNAQSGQKLNWRTSIVDLMKLVGMDSSLQERKELAQELGYTGDKDDSAAMNIWLHKQVMQKLAQNGGKVPKELLD